MKQSTAIATAVVFCGLLAGMLVWFLLSPRRDFSPKENRYLAACPTVTADAVLTGKWSRQFEEYVADQFPARDQWIVMQAAMQRASGSLENNGVYFGDQLIGTFRQYDKTRLQRNLSAIEAFAAYSEIPVYAVPVPNACEINRDLLPRSAPDDSQAEILRQAADAMTDAVLVDTTELLKTAAGQGTQLYYATDHHMTTAGAYRVYAALVTAMGISPLPESAYTKTVVTTDFTGTLYRKSGAWWTKPDSIARWDAPDVKASLTFLPSGKEYDSIYDESALSGNDQYTYFAYGNQPLEIIRTNADGGKLLLIKDSYAHAVLPFLCSHFSEIHMIDLRYDRESVQQYLQNNSFDCAVILYNISNLTEDMNLPLVLQ